MSLVLADELLRSDLAEAERDPQGQLWLGLHPGFGAVYLTALTGILASNHGLTAVTDDPLAHCAAGALSLDQINASLTGRPAPVGIASDLNVAEVFFLHVALAASPQPVDLDRIPVETLVEFHADHEREIRGFRDHLAGLAPRLRGLSNVTEEGALAKEMTRIYNEQTRDLVEELRTALARSRIKTVIRTLNIKFDISSALLTVPGLAAVGLGELVGLSAGVAAAPVAVALSTVPIIQAYRDERARQAKSPVAYLLAAKQELGQTSL